MKPKRKPPTCPSWQEPRRLASNDRIWIITDIETGQEVRREERTVKYNPQPKIVCKDKKDD